MAGKTRRARDAGTGRIVSAAEAKARPGETVTEAAGKDTVASLAARIAIIEQVIAEARGPHARILARLSG